MRHWRASPPLLVLVLCSATSASALSPPRPLSQYHKKYWQTEQNLPGNEVWAVDHAADGHLLVGTAAGLARFDGLRFTSPAIDASVDLAKESISALTRAADGSVWVATRDQGLYRCRDGSARRYDLDPKWGRVRWLLENPAGTLWASTDRALLQLVDDRFVAIPGVTGSRHWYSLAGDGRDTIWAVTAEGLSRVHNGKATRLVSNNDVGTVLSVARGAEGRVWAGTTQGLFRAPESRDRRPERVPGVSGLVVGILCESGGSVWVTTWGDGLYRVSGKSVEHWGAQDREGDLWIGMRTGGLGRWKETFIVPYDTPELTSGYLASAVTEDRRDGSLLLGTWRSGILRFRQERMERFPMLYNPLWISVRALAADARGSTWAAVGTGEIDEYDGARYHVHRLPGDMRASQPSAILADRKGRLWIGTEDKGVVWYRSGNPAGEEGTRILPEHRINVLLEDSGHQVWAGTNQGLYSALDHAPPILRAEIGRQYITSVSEDTQGRVWAGGHNGRIWIVLRDRVATLGPEQGIPPVTIFQVLDDGLGSYWISSPTGIIEVRRQEIESLLAGRNRHVNALVYRQEDGMRSIECHGLSQPAGLRDRQGHLWFPTVKGFVQVRPSDRRTLYTSRESACRGNPRSRWLRIPAILKSASARCDLGRRNNSASATGWRA